MLLSHNNIYISEGPNNTWDMSPRDNFEDMEEAIKRLHAEGVRPFSIAIRLGIPEEIVYKVLEKEKQGTHSHTGGEVSNRRTMASLSW